MARCPDEWEYSKAAGYAATLARNLEPLLRAIDTVDIRDLSDTRPIHAKLFSGLTPPKCPYFAGHYRGEPFPCLERSSVYVMGDPLVGTEPDWVVESMRDLGAQIESAVLALDLKFASARGGQADWALFLYQLAASAADIMQRFLTVHPYVNGNGHVARYLVLAILARYSVRPAEWTLDPRPSLNVYDPASIYEHRRGRTIPLIRQILRMIRSAAGGDAQSSTR